MCRDRRTVLASLATLATGLAGCTGPRTGPFDAEPDSTATVTGPEQAATVSDEPGATDASTERSLDLREANVVDVAVEAAGDGGYRFDVTLFHDDEGEDGYANWWQVETLAGEQLGRRDLSRAHGTGEFTRSETVAVPDGRDCVVVRGHDQMHGYGGRAMLASVGDGATDARRRGSERRSFADADCPGGDAG